jgi:hypothetical protein
VTKKKSAIEIVNILAHHVAGGITKPANCAFSRRYARSLRCAARFMPRSGARDIMSAAAAAECGIENPG